MVSKRDASKSPLHLLPLLFHCTFPLLLVAFITLIFLVSLTSCIILQFIHRTFLLYPPLPREKFSRCALPGRAALLSSQPFKPSLGQPRLASRRNCLPRRQPPFPRRQHRSPSRLPRNENCKNSKTSTLAAELQSRRKARHQNLCDSMNCLSTHHAVAIMLHPREPRADGLVPLPRMRPRHPRPLQSKGP